MKVLRIFLLITISAFTVIAQTDASLVDLKGRFDFDNPDEKILSYRLLDNGTKLWMLGANTIQLWDVPNKSVIYSERHGIEGLSKNTFGGVSPDWQKVLLLREAVEDYSFAPDPLTGAQRPLPDYFIPTDKPDKFIRKASVWDLNSRKRLLLFDNPVYGGYWSKDGKTLVTANFVEFKYPMFPRQKNAAFNFYENDDLKLRSTINVQDLSWSHLSPDGNLFYTTSLNEKKSFLGIPYPNGMTKVVSIWNTKTGQNEKNLSVGGEDYATLTWKLYPSPSGRYLVMVSKHKSKDAEHKILFWEMNGSGAPKYTIKASPRIRDSFISYSPDEELFAIDAGKNIQIFNARTGEKKGEVLDADLPEFWLNNNQILFDVSLTPLRAYSTLSGSKIYETPLYYDSYENVTSTSTDTNGNTTESTETVITDRTTVVPHPSANIFLTHSNQLVKLYKIQNGELIETVVRPPFSVVKEKFAVRNKRYVSDAGWLNEGKILFVVDYDRTAISLWDFKQIN